MVHDLLAFLAEQMLEMNTQKQKEIKGFLGWLEGEVRAKVEDITPKTKVQEYHKLQFDELLVILKKNKRKIAIDPTIQCNDIVQIWAKVLFTFVF